MSLPGSLAKRRGSPLGGGGLEPAEGRHGAAEEPEAVDARVLRVAVETCTNTNGKGLGLGEFETDGEGRKIHK